MSIPSPFALVDTDFNRTTEYALKLNSTAGYATLTYGPNFPGPDTTPTGLANDATAYTATVTVNGTPHAVSVTGSAAQTFAALITEINTDISTWATAALVGNSIVITVTNPTAGPTSTITVADSGTNHLFASVKGQWFGLVNNSSIKGADEYVLWDKLDGVTQDNVSQTVNSFLSTATANTNVAWTSGSDKISFPTGAPVAGTDTGLTQSTVYQLNVNVDGAGGVEVLINLPILETQSFTSFNRLIDAINVGMKAQAVPAVATLDTRTTLALVITSNSVGTSSSVVITDGASNGLLTALAAFGPVNAPATTAGTLTASFAATPTVTPTTSPGIGGVGTNYDFKIAVDGGAATVYTVSLVTADTMTTIASKMDTAATAVVTVAASGNSFVITSKTTGLTSKVVVTHPAGGANADLFDSIATALTAVVSFAENDGTDAAGVNGTTDVTFPVTKNSIAWANWGQVLKSWPSLTGSLYGPLFTGGNKAHLRKEGKPSAKGDAVLTYVYWDGSAWKYFTNDVTIGATVNPPTPA